MATFAKVLGEIHSKEPLIPLISEALEKSDEQRLYFNVMAEYLPALVKDPDAPIELVLRPSSLCKEDECARYHVLDSIAPMERTPVKPDLMCKFDHGTAVHAWIQALMGHFGILERTREKDWECKLIVPHLHVRAKTDGVTKVLDSGSRRLFELKTKKSQLLRTLPCPDDEHNKQGQIYLWLMKEAQAQGQFVGLGDIEDITILYYDKNDEWRDSNTGLPMKEFTVSYADYLLREIWKVVYEANMAWADKELPPRCESCPTASSPKARRCPLVKLCFSCEKMQDVTGGRDLAD